MTIRKDLTVSSNESRKNSLRTYHEAKWTKRLCSDGTLICSKCNEAKPLSEYRIRVSRPTGVCFECRKGRASSSPSASRTAKLKHRYGISDEDYETLLLAQNGVCAICGGPPVGISKKGRLYVDHDHATDLVRGLLCFHCNTLLGTAKDQVAILVSAITYLSREDGSRVE